MPTPRHKLIHNPIPTSLFLSRPQHTSCRQLDVFVLFPNAKQRCRDGVMNDFVSPFIPLYLIYTFIHTCTREERVCPCARAYVCVNKVQVGWGKEPEQNITFLLGLCPKIKKMSGTSVKNHFYEMKGDVGTSHHEKKGNKKMHIPRQKVVHNPIPTSLFLSRPLCRHLEIKMYLCVIHNKATISITKMLTFWLGIFLFPFYS